MTDPLSNILLDGFRGLPLKPHMRSMNQLLRVTLGILCCYFWVAHPSLACSLIVKPLIKFDSSEYVFTGQVTRLVGPLESTTFLQKAWGLQIKAEEKVYLPQTPSGDFEVFPFQLWSDCSIAGTGSEELLKKFPLGSKVKVIARAATLLSSESNVDHVRLEVVPGTWSEISRNYYEDGRRMADSQTVFDYKSFKQVSPKDYVESFMPFLDAKGALPDFELRKDLLRLERTRLRSERVKILRRLLYYPACCGGGDYFGIAKHYLQGSKRAKALYLERESLLSKSGQ